MARKCLHRACVGMASFASEGEFLAHVLTHAAKKVVEAEKLPPPVHMDVEVQRRGTIHGRKFIMPMPKAIGDWTTKMAAKAPFSKGAAVNLHRGLLRVALHLQRIGFLPADALREYEARIVKPSQLGASRVEIWNGVLHLLRVLEGAASPPQPPTSPVPAPPPQSAAPQATGSLAVHDPRVPDHKTCLVCDEAMKRGEDGEFRHLDPAAEERHSQILRRFRRGNPWQAAAPQVVGMP